MKKKLIGIVSSGSLFTTQDLYEDRYTFVNNYGLRVQENGGIPMGLLPVDGFLEEETLEQVDAILICGGRRIYPYHMQAVRHALRTGKPLLGVCLGMQAIHSWFQVEDEAQRRGFTGDLLELYEIMKKERHMFVLPVAHHWDVHMVRGQEDAAKHAVLLRENTQIHRLLGTTEIRGATMHNYRINQPSDRLTVSGLAADGTIEAIEFGRQVLGVQFHPEVDDSLDPLFRFLTGCEG